MQIEELKKGDLIVVFWNDASDIKGTLTEHEVSPEVVVKDWGLYLGVSGRKHRFLIVGKDVTLVHNDWGASRIPIELVDEIRLILPREQVMEFIAEVAARTPDGTYEPKVAPVMFDLAAQIARARRSIQEKELNALRRNWE